MQIVWTRSGSNTAPCSGFALCAMAQLGSCLYPMALASLLARLPCSVSHVE